MSSKEELVKIVLQFKISHLQSLLAFAGQNTKGRKDELQKKALNLISNKPSIPLAMRIKQLHNKRMFETHPEHYHQDYLDAIFTNSIPNQTSQNIMYTDYNSRNYFTNERQDSSYYDQCMIKNSIYPSYSSYNDQRAETSNFNYLNHLDPSIKIPHNPNLNNINFKKLPFYCYKTNIIPVTSLIPTTQKIDSFEFVFQFPIDVQLHSRLSWSKKVEKESRFQVQLRMCLLSNDILNSNEPVEVNDSLPLALSVKVNDKACQLPPAIPSTNKTGVLLKRMDAPINITPQISKKNSVNTLTINWSIECDKLYGISIHFVEKYTSDELITKLKEKGERDPEHTKKYLHDKLNELGDDDIAATSLKVSLICPLGKILMSLPVRATTCNHLQCFDGSLYIRMNEVKSIWQCPVCNQTCQYDDIFIDGFFVNILKNNKFSSKITDIQLDADGSVIPVTSKRARDTKYSKPIKKPKIETFLKPNINVSNSATSDCQPSSSKSENFASIGSISYPVYNDTICSSTFDSHPLKDDADLFLKNNSNFFNSDKNDSETFLNYPNYETSLFCKSSSEFYKDYSTIRNNDNSILDPLKNDDNLFSYCVQDNLNSYQPKNFNCTGFDENVTDPIITNIENYNEKNRKNYELIDLTESDSEVDNTAENPLNLKITENLSPKKSNLPPLYDIDDSDA